MAFQKGKNNQIYDGLQQLGKGYKHILEEDKRTLAEMEKAYGSEPEEHTSIVYSPALVFDGRLFLASLKDDDLEVVETTQVLYLMRNVAGLTGVTAVDVVREDVFGDYLDYLSKDHEAICNFLQSRLSQS